MRWEAGQEEKKARCIELLQWLELWKPHIVGVRFFWFNWSFQTAAAASLSVEIPAGNTKSQLISAGFFFPPQLSAALLTAHRLVKPSSLTALVQRPYPAAVDLYNIKAFKPQRKTLIFDYHHEHLQFPAVSSICRPNSEVAQPLSAVWH